VHETPTDERPRTGHTGSETLSTRLPRALRGYEREATERLVGQMGARQAELERAAARLQEQVDALEGDLARRRRQEELVGKTLLAAMRQAMAIRHEARQEAEALLRKAHGLAAERTALAERVEREREIAEQELLRLRNLTREIHDGLARFFTQALEQLRPAAQTQLRDGEAAAVADASLLHALDAAIRPEVGQLRASGGDARSPAAGS
jgi:cell division septum initiation protein DivIVA